MWQYDDRIKAYVKGNEILTFYRSTTRKQVKNSRLRDSKGTKTRVYIELYNTETRENKYILEKSISGEGIEAQQKVSDQENKIKAYAQKNFNLDSIKWKY